jgi:hypothetical protein
MRSRLGFELLSKPVIRRGLPATRSLAMTNL